MFQVIVHTKKVRYGIQKIPALDHFIKNREVLAEDVLDNLATQIECVTDKEKSHEKVKEEKPEKSKKKEKEKLAKKEAAPYDFIFY